MTDRDPSPSLSGAAPVPAEAAEAAVTAATDPPVQRATIGTRLRNAREAKGLDVTVCAGRLHLPVKVIERLEADDFGEPEHFVFLRGTLQGYARLLGLPAGTFDEALREVAPAGQPALVSVARTSPARWLLQRYGTAATYIILTATIAVPLVLLGLRGGLERPSTRIVSLDQAPSARQAQPPDAAVAAEPAGASPDAAPLRASMTPFSAIGLGDAAAPGTPALNTVAPLPRAIVGQHTLTVNASEPCWFEIIDAGGSRIDSGMLQAGDSRTWRADGELHVTLGNVGGVTVTSDGKPLSLTEYRRANVARFDVFSADPGGEND